MMYFAMTEPTATWLLSRSDVLAALVHELTATLDFDLLMRGDFVAGPLTIATSQDRRVVAIYNSEYLGSSGQEAWGFFKLDTPLGLRDEPLIASEVFERCVYLISRRLQDLIVENVIHRSWNNTDVQTCTAGRGRGRQSNVGWVETGAETGRRSLLIVGPAFGFERIQEFAVAQSEFLPSLLKAADDLVSQKSVKRPVLDERTLHRLRVAVGAAPEDRDQQESLFHAQSAELRDKVDPNSVYSTLDWTYEDWIAPGSPLTEAQRRIVTNQALEHTPIRIIGPAGSGKTLTMQLLAMYELKRALQRDANARLLYVVHNAAMAQQVTARFERLAAAGLLTEDKLLVRTLSEYAKEDMGLDAGAIIDTDAYATKEYQLAEVRSALHSTVNEYGILVSSSDLLRRINQDSLLFDVFARLIVAEISLAIKGRGLENDEERYVGSRSALSRLHGAMSAEERRFVFRVFRKYYHEVFERMEVLDSDDLAISLLGRLKTPIWQLKRRSQGFNYVFVDETQLFNENERRIFHLLTRGTTAHAPIALALDKAQDIFENSAGFGALGIHDVRDEALESTNRSTKAILELAFFVISKSSTLFGADYPDYPKVLHSSVPDSHPNAAPPSLIQYDGQSADFAKFVVRAVRGMRQRNVRQVALVVHSEVYWESLQVELKAHLKPSEYSVLLRRGSKIDQREPQIILTQPAYVGGQEFDAVVIVGLEKGLTLRGAGESEALREAVVQQSYREIYLSVTRARYQVAVALNRGAEPLDVVAEAVMAGVLVDRRAA